MQTSHQNVQRYDDEVHRKARERSLRALHYNYPAHSAQVSVTHAASVGSKIFLHIHLISQQAVSSFSLA